MKIKKGSQNESCYYIWSCSENSFPSFSPPPSSNCEASCSLILVSTHHFIPVLSVVLSSAKRLLTFSMSPMLISSGGKQVMNDRYNPSNPLYCSYAHMLKICLFRQCTNPCEGLSLGDNLWLAARRC